MKILKFGVFFSIIILLTGCGQVKTEEADTFNIVTSFYPVYIFTKNITKDIENVSVTNMTSSHAGCLHDYHLDTRSMKQVESADVFIINGAGFENFMEKIYEKDGLAVIDSSENVELLQGKFSDTDNEHTWLSITNAIIQVENIGKSLAKLDKNNEEKYLSNTHEYIEKLKTLKNELRERLYDVENDINIVTTHDAFPYFAQDFGIKIVDVIEREEGVSPTQKEMKDIIENIKENNVCGIFIEMNYSKKLAEAIANEAGVKVYTLDSVTFGDGSLEDYENKMRNNIETIRENI